MLRRAGRPLWVSFAALAAASCSQASAGETSPQATLATFPPAVTTTVEPPPTSNESPTTAAPAPVAATTDPNPSTSDEPAAPTTVGPTIVAPVVPEDGTDEPVFDPEPLQPLDLAAATFPVDDAGIGGSPPAPDDLPTGWAAFDANLADALLRNGNTAASVAVSIGGDVVHSAAFGQRALDPNDPAETQDRFRVASISKTITAIALLQLVEADVIGIDDPVGGIVADHLGITSPRAGIESITLRHLLNHTAGFGKYDGVFFRGQSADCREAATIGLTRSLSSMPGGSYRYSNMNYCVAGLLVEALTGQPYEAVAYEQVLTPLGLSGLRLAPTFDPGPDEILHPTMLGRNYMETLAASGAWLATPEDLVTIFDSLDLATPGWKPLESDTLDSMLRPVGGQPGQRGYGMGLILYGPGRYGHTGTIESTHAMVMNRGDGVTWAITVSGPYPADTPRLESIINVAFEAGGFVAG